jgi:hypothetical protein
MLHSLQVLETADSLEFVAQLAGSLGLMVEMTDRPGSDWHLPLVSSNSRLTVAVALGLQSLGQQAEPA